MAKKEVDQHFDGSVKGAKIHTARQGRCAKGKPPQKASETAVIAKKKPKKRQAPEAEAAKATCNHQTNCEKNTDAGRPLASHEYNAHHILPVSSVNGYTIIKGGSAIVPKIHKVYKPVNWCINQPENLIALPMKSAFLSADDVFNVLLPAHDLHHNCEDGYTDEVTAKIDRAIWHKVRKAHDKNKEAHFTKNELQVAFETLQTEFRAKLKERAGRHSRTHRCLANKPGEKAWYLAFSMAKTSVAKDHAIECL